MLNIILVIGIVASTFLTGLFIDPFLPPILDSDAAKDFICMVTMLAVIYLGMKLCAIKSQNKWVDAFVLYTALSLPFHPHFRLILGHNDINGFWMYPVELKIIGYYLMYLVISNLEIITNPAISRVNPCYAAPKIDSIFKTIFYCGFASSLYIFIQLFNADQLFTLASPDVVRGATAPSLTGFLGQNTQCGAFIAMTIPFGFYLRRYLFMVVMAIAVLLIQSKMAIASLLIGAALYFVIRTKSPERLLLVAIVCTLTVGAFSFMVAHGKYHLEDNGRYAHWADVLKDFNSPQIVDNIPSDAPIDVQHALFGNNHHIWTLTGIGPGSYHFIYINKHHSVWEYIHNEYLEVLYAFGWTGLILFVIAMLSVFFSALMMSASIPMAALLTSLAIISLNAWTNFIWQINPMQFLTVLIAGLISNQSIRRISDD